MRRSRSPCHRAAPRAHEGTALWVLPTAALLPAAATTGILRSCAAAELLRATVSPPVSRRRHSGLRRLVRDLRRLRKPATPGRGTRQRRAVLADLGLSSCAHDDAEIRCKLEGLNRGEVFARAHRTNSSRQVQGADPGYDPPNPGDQPAADGQGSRAIPSRMARILRLLPDPTGAHQPGGESLVGRCITTGPSR